MRFIDSSQCRAARALLDWSQPELARRSGVHIQTISNFEINKGSPSKNTLQLITQTFELAGILFTSEGGVNPNPYPIIITEGETHEKAYLKLISDAHEHLKTLKDPELLIMYADDRVSPTSINEKYRDIRKSGIKMRQLIEEGNEYIIGPLNEYRYIPKQFFLNRVTLIYGERIASEMADVRRGIIRVDKLNAVIQRNTFNLLWNILKEPQKTTALERFE